MKLYHECTHRKILSPVRTLMAHSVIIRLTGIILICLVLIAISKLIVYPIQQAVKMLRNFSDGEGDLTKRMEVRSSDEMGQTATLASATAQATQEIAKRIGEIQESTNATVNAFNAVSQVISEVNTTSQTIVNFVGEQNFTECKRS